MRIGINTRFLLPHKMEGFGWYTFETISRIVKKHSEHEFVFFFDREYDPRFIFSDNVTPIVLAPQARHPFLFKIWFDYSITRALKKYKCDAFISPDGYVSLRTDLPQLAVIHDLNFEHNPNDLPKNALKYLKKYVPKFAQKAKRILTVSEYSKNDIIATYGTDESKIDVAWNGASPVFKPITKEEQEDVRHKFTAGKSYLLFVGALHKRKNLSRLFEAFSYVKENYDFPHQLLVVGEALWNHEKIFIPDDVKNDLHFTGHLQLSDLAQVMASAELLTFVSYFEGFGIPIVEAMQSGTPVLVGNKTSLPEVGGCAVHYCNPYDETDIAKQIIFLLENPDERELLKNKGLERAKQFSWDKTAAGMWRSFEKMMEEIGC